MSIAISSCLSSDDEYEVSSDATVHAFGLDTIHGKHYPFTIDQVKREIYNIDSLPVGSDTIIDSILIDTFYVTGYVTSHVSGDAPDTILNINNYQNLTGAATVEGLKFKIYAADGLTTRDYTLRINIHQQEPDSLQWTNMTDRIAGFPSASIANRQKAVTLDNNLLVYVPEGTSLTAYRTSTKTFNSWEQISVQGLPALDRIPAFVKNSNETVSPQADAEDVLYASTGDGNVYRSTDGINWNLVEALSGNVETLISSFQGQLIGILGHEGNSYLVTAQEGNTAWPAIDSNTPTVPEEFPTENIYSTEFQTANMLDEIMIVGKTTGEKIIPWAYDGHDWAQMDPGTSYDSYCLTANIGYYPSIIYYGGQFYITGERLQNFYKSDAGLAWYKTESMFLLPKDVELRGNYSLAVDNDNFIWLVIGQSSGTPNEVWRGRLNRLGFKQQ